MSASFALSALIVFVAGIAVIEHQPILAVVLVLMAAGVAA